MRKAADAFRSIGEVSQLVGVPPHVLRYWETQFPQLAPVKRADGRRYYRPEDLHLAAGICELLREEGMTTRGAARLIGRDKGAEVRARGRARLPERFHDGTETTAAVAEGAPPAAEPEAIDAMGDVTDRATPDPSGTAALPETDVSLASPLPMKGAQEPTPRPDEPETAASVKHDELPVDRLTKGSASEAPIAADEPSSGIAAAPPVEADPAGALPDAGTFPELAAMPPTSRLAKPFPDDTGRSASAHDPTADDLPLFPGLAHAAPPPGVWLPRLAAIAATLREMPPPRRPKARMQQLRDRLGALINDDP